MNTHETFTNLNNDRDGKVVKARQFARAVNPSLMPDDEYDLRSTRVMRHPHSSLPARGLTEWASKHMNALLPISNVPFFTFELDPVSANALTAEELEIFSKSAKTLQDIVHYEISQSNVREITNIAYQHVGCIGDVLIYQNGLDFTYFRIDNYVCLRDMYGKPFRILIRKFIREKELDEDQKSKLAEAKITAITRGQESYYPYYVDVVRGGKSWKETHYIGDDPVEGKEKTYNSTNFPYYALRYKHDAYEDYSTSLVEENYGDIISTHAVRETLLEGLAVSNMGFLGFNPSTLTATQFAATRNWGKIPIKDKDTIQFIQPQNIQAVSTSASFDEEMSARIRQIFLMDVANQFTHDRVTAYQISQANQALEMASGGTLSTAKNDYLNPMAHVTLDHLKRKGKIPEEIVALLDDDRLNLVIKSGIDSIASETEDSSVFQFFVEMAQTTPQALESFNINELVRWRAKQKGIPSQIIKSTEDLQREQQAKLQQDVQDQLVSNVGPATSDLTQTLVENSINV